MAPGVNADLNWHKPKLDIGKRHGLKNDSLRDQACTPFARSEVSQRHESQPMNKIVRGWNMGKK